MRTGTVLEIPDSAGRPHAACVVRTWRREGRIFAFRHRNRDYFPLFQFEGGAPKPVVAQLLKLLHPDGGWHALFWFQAANAWLEGEAPADHIDHDVNAVLRAAIHANDQISD